MANLVCEAEIPVLAAMCQKNDATRASIKEAGRMNHLKHSVP